MIKENKELTENIAIKAMPLPEKAYIPLIQHIGRPCDILKVKINDTVKTGQLLACAEASVSSPVHASISGKITAIGEYAHPILGKSTAITIERDINLTEEQFPLLDKSRINSFSPDELRLLIKNAGIVGMGGATFPTHIKLSPPKPVDSLIINGAECEPYLTSDNRLMIEESEGILKGIEIIAKILNVKNIYIAIEDNKAEAISVFKNAILNTQYTIRVLKTKYPQGAEKQLIYSVLRRKVPSGKLPLDVGAVVHNVATCFAVFEAVYKNKPLYERLVTVTGDILKNPGNLKVRIGTPVKDLISFCGPLKKEAKKIIMGGPMMGIAQFSDDFPVIKGTSGILVLSEDEVKEAQEGICLRCGECVKNCPMGLTPALISMAVASEKWDLAKEYGALDCVECGLCSYSCPVNRKIVQAVKYAKTKIKR
ncbi:MAG: electron transport complex subunit RsxC [Candidatus Omnitrophica bacterium CG11_big_fil_rev_8_21_14_0_20_42_13]|uniref:Ion-translocating oxidoreductase complex subunit C n=1 Tax=Candidatus Ghiorseimicrobium undicola TaxID=1974746 RepID=A0A2H0LXC2_9BACT|nr:MAG: electron transport complex subunit RsxC [Candidatus Omnitrophica bacterium CG11_big_fil_rev_8_21_14_0_20_42_13]